MIAPPEFGDAIATHGKRLPWLPDEAVIRWIDVDGVESEASYPADTITVWRFISAIKLPVPRYDFVYLALERGMVPWMGGERAPDDWDDGDTLRADGSILETAGISHAWFERPGKCLFGGNSRRIIGYHATSTAHPAAPQGEEGVEAAFKAWHALACNEPVDLREAFTCGWNDALMAVIASNERNRLAALAPAAIASGREGAE